MTTATQQKLESKPVEVPRHREKRGLWLTGIKLFSALAALGAIALFPYWHIVQDKLMVDRLSQKGTGETQTGQAHLEQWQSSLRQRIMSALKIEYPQPHSVAPGSFKVVEDKLTRTMMFNGVKFTCRRQTLEFDSHSGVKGFGYLLLPAEQSATKLPCVICLPGHGAGVDHAVGIDPDGSLMRMWDGTPRDFGLFYACRGYAVLAIEQVGIGRRAQAPKFIDIEKTECLFSDAHFRYTGRTSLGERVLDAMSALTYLQTRSEIDADRIALMGISAGGTTALFTAALDERVKCAVIVSAFSTYADSIFRQVQCMCNYVPGLPQLADTAEIASLICPRSLFIESGLTDDRFPARSAQVAFENARRYFALQGKKDNIELDLCNHGHRCFFGKKSAEFLATHLRSSGI